MPPRFAFEPYTKRDRSGFACGNPAVDAYFKTRLSQELGNDYARCRIAVEVATDQIAGFYTLSSHHVPLDLLPAELKDRLPRYPAVPAPLLGWLGRDLAFKGLGLGEALVFDALKTVDALPLGAYAVITDAIDPDAERFYDRLGFKPLTTLPNGRPRLFIPMKDARVLLRP